MSPTRWRLVARPSNDVARVDIPTAALALLDVALGLYIAEMSTPVLTSNPDSAPSRKRAIAEALEAQRCLRALFD